MPGGPLDAAPPSGANQDWRTRFFTSRMYFRLWCAQVVSSIGDWIGFLAIAAAATRIGGGSPETAVGLVMSARIVPGFFLGPAAGVLVDRWDRKKVMVTCDVIRAATLATIPFIDHVWQLLIASLVMEMCTLLWAPAKEASVPNLVPADRLTTANSLSLAAAYGTFPFASLVFALLVEVADQLGRIDALDWLQINQESLAFWFDTMTFLVSAVIIWRLALPRRTREERPAADAGGRASWTQAFSELKEGWRFIVGNPVVRAVNLGLAVGLIGGGMLVPLGPVFSDQVLGAGGSGFGLLTTALGFGVAAGVLVVSVIQKRVSKERMFSTALLVAGTALAAAASSSWLSLALLAVAVLGVCTGTVYVLGFTLLHENVTDELRGRIFSALYTLVRLCVLIAFAVGPLLSGLLGSISESVLDDSRFEIGGISVYVPGVRLTLWLASAIIFGAAALAIRSLRSIPTPPGPDPVSGEVPAPGRASADA